MFLWSPMTLVLPGGLCCPGWWGQVSQAEHPFCARILFPPLGKAWEQSTWPTTHRTHRALSPLCRPPPLFFLSHFPSPWLNHLKMNSFSKKTQKTKAKEDLLGWQLLLPAVRHTPPLRQRSLPIFLNRGNVQGRQSRISGSMTLLQHVRHLGCLQCFGLLQIRSNKHSSAYICLHIYD